MRRNRRFLVKNSMKYLFYNVVVYIQSVAQWKSGYQG